MNIPGKKTPKPKLTSEYKVVFQDGHEGGHLTEEQSTMIVCFQLGQDTIQKLKFTSDTVEVRTLDNVTSLTEMLAEGFLRQGSKGKD